MPSSDVKYIGLDVHKEAIAIAVLNGAGKLVTESIVETKASTLLDFLHGPARVLAAAHGAPRSRGSHPAAVEWDRTERGITDPCTSRVHR